MTRDTQAYQAFAAARIGHLYRSACLLTGGDVHLAEDLVQETLARILVRWRRVSAADNPAAYAQTMLVRAHLSWHRRRSSRERPVPQTPEAPLPNAPDTDLRVTLINALGRLSERDRAVLILRYWEDRTAEQTADVLAMNLGAVRAHAVRALARLRQELGDEYPLFADR